MPGGNVTRDDNLMYLAAAMTLSFMALGMLLAGHASAQGDDLEEERWSGADSPILLEGTWVVEGDTRLVIEAGVEVRFSMDARMVVRGELSIEGTEAEPVLLTSNTTGVIAPDLWSGVLLHQESADRDHQVRWAIFEGADTGLNVQSTDVALEDCEFRKNRNGVLAAGEAAVDLTRCAFIENSVLGLEWQSGAGGTARGCTFLDTAVGVYCYEGSSPTIEDCVFEGNYHHLSFAKGANATVRACALSEATAEAMECYWNSSPVLVDVTFEEGDGPPRVFLNNGSRPRLLRGTNASSLRVDATDVGSYVVVLQRISVHVTSDEGGDLVSANVTIRGASGDVLWSGTTGEGGRVSDALMSAFTVSAAGASVLEHPHEALVEWSGHEQTFMFGPEDLTDDSVLELEMALSSPEPGGWGWVPIALIVLAISICALIIAGLRRSGIDRGDR